MKGLRFTLVTDGPSDGYMLVPVLEWLLREHCKNFGINVDHANYLKLRDVPKGLSKRIAFALEAYPCDALFVHRDAERDPPDARRREIDAAVASLAGKMNVPIVRVVPVRMSEAWLLFDEAAIRRASGNPNGRTALNLPPIRNLEETPDPKRLLHDLLLDASELTGRRRRSFNPRAVVHLIARSLDDFSPLRKLAAFQALETDIRVIAAEQRWDR